MKRVGLLIGVVMTSLALVVFVSAGVQPGATGECNKAAGAKCEKMDTCKDAVCPMAGEAGTCDMAGTAGACKEGKDAGNCPMGAEAGKCAMAEKTQGCKDGKDSGACKMSGDAAMSDVTGKGANACPMSGMPMGPKGGMQRGGMSGHHGAMRT